jgi:hypothetical protein
MIRCTDLLLKVGEPTGTYWPQGERERKLLQMLAYQVDARHHQTSSGEVFLTRLQTHSDQRIELAELGEVLQSRSILKQQVIPGLEDVPLCLHSAYGSLEILKAVGGLTSDRRTPFQAVSRLTRKQGLAYL